MKNEPPEPAILRKISEPLTRSQIDRARRAVQQFFDQQPQNAKEAAGKLTKLAKESPAESMDRKIYPPSPEMFSVALNLALRREREEFTQSFFHEFGGNTEQLVYAFSLMQMGGPNAQRSFISRSLLPSVCRAMEQAQAGLIRTALQWEKDGLGDMPPIPSHIFDQFGKNVDTRDIDRWRIDLKVQDFLAQRPAGWRDSILNWTNFDMSLLCPNWSLTLEAFEISHLLGKTTEVVVESDAKTMELLAIPIDPNYVLGVIDEIECLLVGQSSKWISRILPDKDFVNFNSILLRYELMRRDRWSHAICMIEAESELPNVNEEDRQYDLVEYLYCLQEAGRETPAITRAVDDMQPVDEVLEIGKYAALRKYDRVQDSLRRLLTSVRYPIVLRGQLRSCPLLQRAMREAPDLRSLLVPGGAKNQSRVRRQVKKRR